MSSLSHKQEEIVNCIHGQVLVVSCPGSGKTTVIVNRAAKMVEEHIPESNILIITFTKEAATQMKNRYEKEFGKTNIFFGTIHAFCFRILTRAYGYKREDILLASEQWDFFRRQLYKKIDTTDLEEYIKSMLTEISYVRNKEIPVSSYEPQNSKKEIFVAMFEKYNEYKKALGKIDFDDMLILSRECLRSDKKQLDHWQKQFPYIMIDEYQDTNSIQAEIFYMLAGKNGNICVVGDDDQSIYGFRSADSKIMLDFPKVYPNCKRLYLDTNYRSGKNILSCAAKLISHNRVRFKKNIEGAKEENGSVKVSVYDGAKDQTMEIIKKIEDYHKKGVPYDEMSVLYRSNIQNQLLIGALMKKEIPFYTTEPPKDYHSDFMFGDFMAYYRLAEGNWQKGDVQRILNRPSRYLKADAFKGCGYNKDELVNACQKLGRNTPKAMLSVVEMMHDISCLAGKPPYEFCQFLLKGMGYNSFIDHFCEFCQRDKDMTKDILNLLLEEAKMFQTMEDWQEYANEYSLRLQEKRAARKKEGVCLSTFHSAKGLEWDVVFIIDANEDITPYRKATKPEEIEEERRLFYVALTRARKQAHISYTLGSEQRQITRSRFIPEMGIMEEQEDSTHIMEFNDKKAKPILC